MPWSSPIPFEATAEDGEFNIRKTENIPISGTLQRLRVKTTSRCDDREHIASASIDGQTYLDGVVIKDCTIFEHRKNISVDPGEVELEFTCDGFDSQEVVKGEIRVKYSLFSLAAPLDYSNLPLTYASTVPSLKLSNNFTNINILESPEYISMLESSWVRVPAAEDKVKEELQELEGRNKIKDSWNRKSPCGWLGHQKHGRWRKEYVDINTDFGSIKISLNRNEARAVGYASISAYANWHHKSYNCGVKRWEARAQAWASVDVSIEVDISSGHADVNITHHLLVGRVIAPGDYGATNGAVKALLILALDERLNEMELRLERKVEEAIDDFLGVGFLNVGYPLMTESFIETIGLDRIIDDKDCFNDVIDELSLLGVTRPTQTTLQVFEVASEINRELIARTLNARTLPFNPDRIEDEDNGIWFDEISITLSPNVAVGSVRIILSPVIQIILEQAQVNIHMTCTTNLLEDEELTINGNILLSFQHTYGNDIIEFDDLQFDTIEVEQLPGWSELIKRQLNQQLPEQIRQDTDSLRTIASVINEAIDDALDNESFELMTHESFVQAATNGKIDSDSGCCPPS